MKRKLFAILLALAICVSAAVPAMAASRPGGCSVRPSCLPCPGCCRDFDFGCWPEEGCPGSVCPNPGEPSEPETPSEPEQPLEPELPIEPELPAEPELPSEPETPAEPEIPSEPETPAEPELPSEPEQPEVSDGVHAYERQVVELVNVQRARNGLQPLSLDAGLCRFARVKSQDMHDNRYFDHTSPTYGSPFDMMRQFGITYASAGENIAMGYSTPEAVVNAWMNSSGHRANILSAKYTTLGVGFVSDGGYWTQWFIG